jgi:hypothetical protein
MRLIILEYKPTNTVHIDDILDINYVLITNKDTGRIIGMLIPSTVGWYPVVNHKHLLNLTKPSIKEATIRAIQEGYNCVIQ